MTTEYLYRSDSMADAMASAFITSNQVPALPVYVNLGSMADGKRQLGYFVEFERGSDCKAVIEGGKKVEYND